MGLMIDTSALVAIERQDMDISKALAAYGKESVAVPMIVWAELLVGVRLSENAQVAAGRRARLEQIRLHVPLIEFNAMIAEQYADIFAECLRSGHMIPQNDIAVAATARCHNFSVLVGSQDEAHFRRVRGLNVVTLEDQPGKA